jgi:hypothetical protein
VSVVPSANTAEAGLKQQPSPALTQCTPPPMEAGLEERHTHREGDDPEESLPRAPNPPRRSPQPCWEEWDRHVALHGDGRRPPKRETNHRHSDAHCAGWQ